MVSSLRCLLPFAEDDMDFGLRIRKQADLVLWRAELPARANDLYADLLGCQPHDFALELVTHFWRDDIIGDVVAVG
jgi:hypothetical protein